MGGVGATDASGNPILGDVGKWFYDKVLHTDSEFSFASFPSWCVVDPASLNWSNLILLQDFLIDRPDQVTPIDREQNLPLLDNLGSSHTNWIFWVDISSLLPLCLSVQVKAHFGSLKFPIDVKYIDPTYMIRARACNSSDHIFCSILGQNAVSLSSSEHSTLCAPCITTSMSHGRLTNDIGKLSYVNDFFGNLLLQ